MNKEKMEHFKSILTRTLDDLLSEKEKKSVDLIGLKDGAGDYADLASLDTDRTLYARLRERESKLAARIMDALRKLEDGTFGICEECGQPIPEKRLMARPIARLCIKCKEKQEKQEMIWEQ
jgi:DnaK suppressor protein